jgi:hypothetical protein
LTVTIDTERVYPNQPEANKLVAAFGNAAEAIRDSVGLSEPELVSVKIATIMGGKPDTYELRQRGTLTKPRMFVNNRPGKIAPMNGEPGDVLRSFFSMDEEGAWGKLPDAAVQTFMLKFAREARLHPEQARSLSLAVNLALCTRAGFAATRDDIYSPEAV